MPTPNAEPRILVAGEINVDLILGGYRTFPVPGREVLVEDASLTLGSASAICAAGLARLGNRVSFIGRIGRDVYGDYCLKAMRAFGLDLSLVVSEDSLKTGITVSISNREDRALVTYPGAIDSLTAAHLPDEMLRSFRHIHTSSYFLQRGLRPGLSERLAAARSLGLTTSLDPGFDPSEEWGSDLLDTLPNVDVFFPNEVELSAISGHSDPETALRKLRNGVTLTVAKLGSAGCMALHPDTGALVVQKPFPVNAIDSTGAGDSFNAGFLHSWLRGQSLPQCLEFGAACGAMSTRGPGGTGAQPTLEQARLFIDHALRDHAFNQRSNH